MTEEFKVLDDREHCLLRGDIFIGSMSEEPFSRMIDYKYQSKVIVPALIKLVEEALSNSQDENIRTFGKFANEIDLTVKNTIDGTEISVSDNGRGIPVELIDGKYRPVLAWTSLRAGSNFDDSKGRITSGKNGYGICLVSIFSSSFTGITDDGKKRLILTCSDNMQNVDFKVGKTTGKRGTTVKFTPDLSRFGVTEFSQDHIDVLKDQLHNLAIQFPLIQFSFNGEKIKFKNFKQVAKNFHESAIYYQEDNVQLVFAPSGKEEEFRLLSYVNGINTKLGGTHVDYMMDKIIANLREHITKKHKISVLPNNIKQHLLFASWITKMPNCRFESQSKERITNTVAEVSSHLKDVDFDKISKQILNTPEIIDPIISAILYKKEREEAALLAKKQKAVAKVRIVNHVIATDPDPEKRTLFITEGISSIGNLISGRNPKIHGGISLRGKPLNVRGMKPIDIVKNKEMFELMSVIGLEFGKPATDLNYGKIAIMVDSDTDGVGSIQCLLLNMFSYWPELFSDKRIYRLMTPLYICTKSKTTKYFYTKEEFDAVDTKGYEITYAKGLGTLSKEVYRDCINDPVMIRISGNPDDFDKLELVFGDDATKRKEWILNENN